MSVFSNLTDNETGKSLFIDGMRNLRAEATKRILGSAFGATLDTNLYVATPTNAGAVNVANGVASLVTNTTASGAVTLATIKKARYMSGRANLFRGIFRFGDTGVTGNVREFGIQADASNKFVFRLSGTTFSVVVQRAGTETVVSSGSFNGNGVTGGTTTGTYAVDANYHAFEVLYTTSAIRFIIDDRAVHTFKPTTTSLTVSLVGVLWASNVNTTIATNQLLELLAWSASHIGDAVNNPNFYNINAIAETRTLKGGGGTLQAIQVGKIGGTGATLTIYDSTTATGTIINSWDLSTIAAIGNQPFAVEGVNFYNGLTYITSGTMTGASITVYWE